MRGRGAESRELRHETVLKIGLGQHAFEASDACFDLDRSVVAPVAILAKVSTSRRGSTASFYPRRICWRTCPQEVETNWPHLRLRRKPRSRGNGLRCSMGPLHCLDATNLDGDGAVFAARSGPHPMSAVLRSRPKCCRARFEAMMGDVDLSAVATLLGDPTRARMLQALHDSRALPAGELARRAGVSPSTASGHLARLADGGLVTVERGGRHRYYRLAGPDVARALEALTALAPVTPPRNLREATIGDALAGARTCYDHLAGRLGVELTDALVERDALEDTGEAFQLGPEADAVLASLGIETLPSRRPHALRCLDWSERRPHVAGGIGAAICERALTSGWIERLPTSRAVRLTPAGKKAFARLGL